MEPIEKLNIITLDVELSWINSVHADTFYYVSDRPYPELERRLSSVSANYPYDAVNNRFVYPPSLYASLLHSDRSRFGILEPSRFSPWEFPKAVFPSEVCSVIHGPSLIYITPSLGIKVITPTPEGHWMFANYRSAVTYVSECYDDFSPVVLYGAHAAPESGSVRPGCDLPDIDKAAKESALATLQSAGLSVTGEQEQLLLQLIDVSRRLLRTGFSPELMRQLQESTSPTAMLHVESGTSALSLDMDGSLHVIDMKPRQRMIYRLFLDCPSGMCLKELPSREKELRRLYREINGQGNPSTENRCIENIMFNLPTVNEILSRIKAAFLGVLDDSLARHYYISGGRASVRKITLDRSLVVFDD